MSDAHQQARAALARGDFAAAYDITVSAIAAGDESEGLRHQQVLALGRMGDTETAFALFSVYGLDRSSEPDELAVGARLLKDRAFALQGRARPVAMAAAADAYRAVFDLSGALRPGVNAASLSLLAGQGEAARDLARRLLMHPDLPAAGDHRAATRKAELLLVLERFDQAIAVLAAAGPRPFAAAADRASTSRQLGAIAAAVGLDASRTQTLLGHVRPPAAIHFTGRACAPDAATEAAIAAAIADSLATRDVGFAYGTLSAGGELLAAEAVLARGGELHVVLPFDEADFIAHAVRPAGEPWVARYRAAVAAATSVIPASAMPCTGDPAQHDYADRMAMGLARLKSRHLDADVFRLGIGVAAEAMPGMATWRDRAGENVSIAMPGAGGGFTPPPPVPAADTRTTAAILFTDFPGFSKLSEQALPAFWNGVMRRVAEVLDAQGDAVECRNSWGDALYAVTRSAAVSAEIALSLQGALAGFDYASLGLKASMGMRIGAHFGTVYRARDHITGKISFYGGEVSRAARIEPVTPPGAVFVTEPFAAMLMLEAPDRFTTRYVGRIDLAKGAGSAPMYRLTRA
ncbi:adenylate/guanylate cyclase domain-containing protein [Sphingomonas solaris]|uniref:Adenylate/guanylate cyclase domain-containing protein n=1 Tax=Alterirhizorhabdus solaris TaxID=2529389 RepID=A0A558QTR6_9SPHN|nr:adenylate/guanylate cyclase domain-containing protein [Sphingomonas solaris]TVV70519.1 adenylate/guanylate cyclase domain-containing protein [Sphingomonas solaris]